MADLWLLSRDLDCLAKEFFPLDLKEESENF